MTPVEFILTFSIGGMTLRAIITLLKKKFNIRPGIPALFLSFLCCAVASAIYILIAQYFNLPLATWSDFLLLAAEVFAGSQIAHRVMHP